MTARFATSLLLSSALALGTLGAFGAARADDAVRTVPMDHAARVDGVRVACAGVGAQSQNDPRWDSYPVKLSFVGDYGQYLGHERVAIRDRQGRVLDIRCDAPWVLMALRPGHYRATATIPGGAVKQVSFTAPRRGQRRIVLRYRGKTGGEPMHNAAYRSDMQQSDMTLPSGPQ